MLQSEGYERIADQVSRSACDALLSYFYEQGNQGQNAQIDYHFLDNMFTGEGGTHHTLKSLIRSSDFEYIII